MSVVSSRSTSSISSILKKTGFRDKLIARQNRVTFQIPKNLKKIIIDYETECDKRVYADFICILRDAVIKVSTPFYLISNYLYFIKYFYFNLIRTMNLWNF